MRFKYTLPKVESFNACWCSCSKGFTNFLLLFYNDPYIGLIYLEMVVTTAADLSPWSISSNSTFSCYIMTFLCFLGALLASLVALCTGLSVLLKVYSIVLNVMKNTQEL